MRWQTLFRRGLAGDAGAEEVLTIEILETGFVYLLLEMLLGVLGFIDFTIILSKSLMWYVFIVWCKLKVLPSIFIEFNLTLKTPQEA